MILVDTSIWIDHLHRAEPALVRLLEADEVCCHPAVIEELALGSIARRTEVIALLASLRQLPAVQHDEVLSLIDSRRLWGSGLSAVDVRLLASALVSPGVRLWTRDKRLQAAAAELDVAAGS